MGRSLDRSRRILVGLQTSPFVMNALKIVSRGLRKANTRMLALSLKCLSNSPMGDISVPWLDVPVRVVDGGEGELSERCESGAA